MIRPQWSEHVGNTYLINLGISHVKKFWSFPKNFQKIVIAKNGHQWHNSARKEKKLEKKNSKFLGKSQKTGALVLGPPNTIVTCGQILFTCDGMKNNFGVPPFKHEEI